MIAAAPASAQAPPELEPVQLERLVREGRCAAALPELERARRSRPRDPAPMLLSGRCRIDRAEYAEATTVLEAAAELAPHDAEIQLELGIARYHAGETAGAREALEAAAPALAGTAATWHLYRGLVHLAERESLAAAGALQQARLLDAAAVEPMASYYAGLAWAAAGERAAARAALARVVAEWPGTSWATEAARIDARLSRRISRWWGTLTLGGERDDNAILLGDASLQPNQISGKGDERLVWNVELGAELFRNAGWAAGALVAYGGNLHRDIDEYDTHYPSFSGWLDRRVGESDIARFQYDIAFAWVDKDSFNLTQRWGLSFFRNWERAGTTALYGQFYRTNYLITNRNIVDADENGDCGGFEFCSPAGTNESSALNRDANGLTFGVEHSLILGWLGGIALRVGYEYDRYSARGTEYSYQSHRIEGGVRAPLPYRLALDVSASYAYRPYRHPTILPDKGQVADAIAAMGPYELDSNRRRERTTAVDAVLERSLTDRMTASFAYRYRINQSTADLYSYNRHVFGVYVTVAIGN